MDLRFENILHPERWAAQVASEVDSTIILFAVGLVLAVTALLLALGPRRYVQQRSLFTKTELTFHRALERVVDDRVMVFAKVRMCDLITPAGKEGGRAWWRAFRRISSKHIDFVLAERDGTVLLAIELDDDSHRRRDRRKRDRFVNSAFAQARLPLWRVPVHRSRDLGWLRRELERQVPSLSRRP